MEKNIKKTYACASINAYQVNAKLVSYHLPKAGDVGIFRVLEADREYVKTPNESNHYLFTDDLILAVIGNRYATNQIEGYVPKEVIRDYQLISRGGVVGEVKSVNTNYKRDIIPLELVGYATDKNGTVLNTIDWSALRETFNTFPAYHPKVILSVGSAMDSGKTTTAAWLSAGLRNAGKKSVYLKLTGTAYPKDMCLVQNRGAFACLDFTYFGFPSTFQLSQLTLLKIHKALLNIATDKFRPDYIIVEIADGLLQKETRALLTNPAFMATVTSVVYSCGDSLGVLSGLKKMEEWNIKAAAVTGLFTASELLIREVEGEISVPVLRREDLYSAEVEQIVGRPNASFELERA